MLLRFWEWDTIMKTLLEILRRHPNWNVIMQAKPWGFAYRIILHCPKSSSGKCESVCVEHHISFRAEVAQQMNRVLLQMERDLLLAVPETKVDVEFQEPERMVFPDPSEFFVETALKGELGGEG